MDSQTWIAIAALAATALGSAGVLGQIVVARRQANLQEVTAYREQADAWAGFALDWHRMLLAGLGPGRAIAHGVDRKVAENYREQLEAYRRARVEATRVMDEHGFSGDHLEEAWEAEASARDALAGVEASVRRVLVHLAQLASLVLNGRLSVAAVYDAIGHDVLREHDALISVTRYAYDYGGCIAPIHEEARSWGELSVEEISERVGWARALRASVGTLDRIDVLIDLLVLRAHKTGDQTDFYDGAPYVDYVGASSRLAYRFRTIRRFSVLGGLQFCWAAAWFRDRRLRGEGGLIALLRDYEANRSEALHVLLRASRRVIRPVVVGYAVGRAVWNSNWAENPERWLTPVGWDRREADGQEAALDSEGHR